MESNDNGQQPEFIRLMDASGSTVLDSVATEYEDSFCIESFGDLVRATAEAEPAGSKHFIIARVQTWDHKQPDKAFYSYYHAHHLNKLLFQTQVYLDKKLIHRLHVLNPLTNTDIIGHVLYFMVKGRTVITEGAVEPGVVSAAVIPESPLPAPEYSVKQREPQSQQQSQLPKSPLKITIGRRRLSNNLPPCSPSVAVLPPISDPLMLNRAIHNQSPIIREAPHDFIEKSGLSSGNDQVTSSNTQLNQDFGINDKRQEKEMEPLTPKSAASLPKTLSFTSEQQSRATTSEDPAALANNGWTLTGTVSGPVDKDETIEIAKTRPVSNYSGVDKSPVAVASRSTAKKPIPARLQILVHNSNVVGAREIVSAGFAEDTNRNANWPMSASAAVAPMTSIPEECGPAGKSNSIALKPYTPIQRMMGSPNSPLKANVPAGVVSQYGQPLTPVQALAIVPPSARSRRRSLSYMNSISTAGAFGTINAWQTMVQQDRPNAQLDLSNSLAEVLKNKEALESASGVYDTVRPFTAAAENATSNQITANADKSIIKPAQATVKVYYDAWLIATDTDFLESSKIRAMFRENAAQPSDFALFEMAPYTGETASRAANQAASVSICDKCFPSDRQLRRLPLGLQVFHHLKCYLLVILLAAALVLFVFLLATSNRSTDASK